MPDLLVIAENLRLTRAAQRRFLAMWALECLLDRPHARQRLGRDLQATPTGSIGSDHGGSLPYEGNPQDE